MVRTITTTTVNSSKLYFEEGQPKATENEAIIYDGKLNDSEALKLVRKTYGELAQVTALSTETATYEMPVSTFIAHATKK